MKYNDILRDMDKYTKSNRKKEKKQTQHILSEMDKYIAEKKEKKYASYEFDAQKSDQRNSKLFNTAQKMYDRGDFSNSDRYSSKVQKQIKQNESDINFLKYQREIAPKGAKKDYTTIIKSLRKTNKGLRSKADNVKHWKNSLLLPEDYGKSNGELQNEINYLRAPKIKMFDSKTTERTKLVEERNEKYQSLYNAYVNDVFGEEEAKQRALEGVAEYDKKIAAFEVDGDVDNDTQRADALEELLASRMTEDELKAKADWYNGTIKKNIQKKNVFGQPFNEVVERKRDTQKAEFYEYYYNRAKLARYEQPYEELRKDKKWIKKNLDDLVKEENIWDRESNTYINPVLASTHVKNMQDGIEQPFEGEIAVKAINNTPNFDKYYRYTQMEDEEKDIYNSLWLEDKKNGTNKAEEYADLLEPYKAELEARDYADVNSGVVRDLITAMGAYSANQFTGLTQLGHEEAVDDFDPILKRADQISRERLEKEGKTGRLFLRDAVGTTLGQSPFLALNFVPVAGQYLYSAATFGSASGNKYRDMIQQGYSPEEAIQAGIVSGVAEVTLQKVLGKLPGVKSVLPEAIAGKALGKINNGVARALINTGVSMASEGLEEGLQTVLEPLYTNAITGANEEIDWEQVGHDALIGALSGGVFGSVDVVHDAVSTSNLGRGLKASDVAKYAKSVGQDSKVAKLGDNLQRRIDNNRRVSDYNVGMTFQRANEAVAEKTKQQIRQRVEAIEFEKGKPEMTDRDIDQFVSGMYKRMVGEDLTQSEFARLSAYNNEANIIEAEFNNLVPSEYGNDFYNQSAIKQMQSFSAPETIAQKDTQTDDYTYLSNESIIQENAIEQAKKNRNSIFNRYEYDSTPMTVELNDGTVSTTNDVRVEDGNMVFELDDGQVVSLDDMNVSDDFKDTVEASRNLRPEYRIDFIKNKPKDMDLAAYTNVFKSYARQGGMGRTFADTEANYADLMNQLPDINRGYVGNVKKMALEVGRRVAQQDAELHDAQVRGQAQGKGGIVLDGIKENELSKSDKEKVVIASHMSKAFGVKVRLYKSDADKPYGSWKESDNEIALDLNEENVDGVIEKTFYSTMAHELTHWGKSHNLKGYNEFVRVVDEYARSQGDDLTVLADEYQREHDVSDDTALEEIVAQYSEPMLRDSKLFEKAFKGKSDALKLISDVLKKMKEKINAFIKANPKALTADEMKKIRALQDSWEKFIVGGLENKNTKAEIEGDRKSENEKVSNNPKYKLREYSQHQKNNWKNSKSIIVYEDEMQFRNFISEAKSNSQYYKKIYFGAIPSDLAVVIKSNTGLDVDGYNCSLSANEIRKIFKDHGTDKTEIPRGQRAITDDDIVNIPVVMQSPDDISLSDKKYMGKPVINMSKTLDGKMTIAAVVSDKHLDLYVQTAYVGAKKRNLATPTAEQAAVNTPEASSGTVSNNSIRNIEENSKEKFSLRENVEETKDLIAVHNLSAEKLMKSMKLGGLPMPSIAIARAKEGFDKFGDISLVFYKDTIDPGLMNSNKVYGADAWTPTYPRIEYKIDDKEVEKIKNKVQDLLEGTDYYSGFGYIGLDDSNVESYANYGGSDKWSHYKSSYGLKAAFLKEKNIDFEIPSKEKNLTQRFDNGAVIAVAHNLGKEQISELRNSGDSSRVIEKNDKIKEIVDKWYSEKTGRNMSFDMGLTDSLNIINGAYKYFEKGIEQESDYAEGRKVINELIDDSEFSTWVDNLFDSVVEKEGIRNNKDLHTPSGNRRSFEALHYEHNLENVVRAMKNEGEQGLGGFGGNIRGAAANKFNSIEEIKTKADKSMTTISQEEFDAMSKGFSDRLWEMASILPKNDSAIARDDAANMLIEAVAKYKTKSGISNFIKKESEGWANYSDHIVEDLIELVEDIQNAPVDYFEAKPQRAVYFNEVAAAIIPQQDTYESDLSALKSELNKLGVNVVEYEYGNKNSRTEALNSISDVKFSDRDSNGRELSAREKFYKEIENWDKTTTGFSFVVGTTSDALQQAGIPKKQIRMDSSKMKKILDKHIGMTVDTFKGMPELLENPVIVIDSKQNKNAKLVMGELHDEKGKLVTAVLLLTPTSKKGNVLNIIKISSVQGRRSIESLFRYENGANVPIKYVDKKRIQNWLNANRLQLPLRSFNLNSDNSIPNSDENINTQKYGRSRKFTVGK